MRYNRFQYTTSIKTASFVGLLLMYVLVQSTPAQSLRFAGGVDAGPSGPVDQVDFEESTDTVSLPGNDAGEIPGSTKPPPNNPPRLFPATDQLKLNPVPGSATQATEEPPVSSDLPNLRVAEKNSEPDTPSRTKPVSEPVELLPGPGRETSTDAKAFSGLDATLNGSIGEGSTGSSLSVPTNEDLTIGGESLEGMPLDEQLDEAFSVETIEPALDTSASIFSTSDWFRTGRWYTDQNVKLLLRTDLPLVTVGGQGLTVEPVFGNFTFTEQSLSTVDAGFTYEAGAELTIGKFLGRDIANRDHALEFTFLGLFDYTGRAAIQSDGLPLVTLLVPVPFGTSQFIPGTVVPGFAPSDQMSLEYTASFNSYEMNYRVHSRPGRDRMALQPNGRWVRHSAPSKLKSMLIGFRSVHVDESLLYQGSLDGLSAANNQLIEVGSAHVRTDNEMYGFQLGFESREKYAKWNWGVGMKAGGLINFVRRVSDYDFFSQEIENGVPIDTSVVNRDEDIRDENLTVLLEAGVDGTYYLRPNFGVRASYDVMYLQGVANAPDNMFMSATFPKFKLTGDNLYHGLSMGFEMVW